MDLLLTGLAAVAGLYVAMVLLRRVWHRVPGQTAARRTATSDAPPGPPRPPQVFDHLIAALRERAARRQGAGDEPSTPPGDATPPPEGRVRLREMVLAPVQPFAEEDRPAWERRCRALARRIVEAHGGHAGPACAVWESALCSLAALPGPLPDAPAWFTDRHAAEERRLLEAYRQAHLDLLCAVLATG